MLTSPSTCVPSGLKPLVESEEETRVGQFWSEKTPTVLGSAVLGLLAIGLGVDSFLAPQIAAQRSVWILALFFGISGVSEIVCAIHGRNWSQILATIFFALLNIAAGVALFLDTQIVAKWAGGLFGIAFGMYGLARIAVAVRSRLFLQLPGTAPRWGHDADRVDPPFDAHDWRARFDLWHDYRLQFDPRRTLHAMATLDR